MRRQLTVSRMLERCPPGTEEAFSATPDRWLPEPARWRGGSTWTAELSGAGVRRLVSCHVGSPWRVGDELWRSITWTPVEQTADTVPVERGLPSLTGELGLRADTEPRLVLRGNYTPPAGLVGQVADSLGLHRVARATAERFLDEVARRLEEAAGCPSGSSPARG